MKDINDLPAEWKECVRSYVESMRDRMVNHLRMAMDDNAKRRERDVSLSAEQRKALMSAYSTIKATAEGIEREFGKVDPPYVPWRLREENKSPKAS